MVTLGGARDRVVLDVVDEGKAPTHEVGDNIAAHVPVAAWSFRIAGHGVDQDIGVEHVDAHGGEDLLGGVWKAGRVLGLLQEGLNLVVGRVDLDDAELVSQLDRLANGGDRHAGTTGDMLGDHVAEVHPVYVVGPGHHDDVWLGVVHQVQALVDRIRAALEPALVDPLLGRHRRHIVADHRRHPPRGADVAVQAVRLVLGEHHDLQISRVHDVAERKVDQPVDAAERHRRLGPVGR